MKSNNKLSKDLRIALLVAGLILLGLNLFNLEYGKFFTRDNLSAGLRILANIFIIAAMVISLRYTAKKDPK